MTDHAPAAPHCARHPDQETHIRCQRCDRPICPDCMRPAAVGFQCPDCVKEGTRNTRQAQARYGGERSSDPRLTTFVLIGINVAVFLLLSAVPRLVGVFSQHLSGLCSDGKFIYPNITNDALCTFVVGGNARWSPGLENGAWWQALTQMFSHQAIWHIASNMIALYFLGPLVEQVLGRVRFVALYLVAGLGGGLAALWLSDQHRSVLGASGAIWGIMGAGLVLAVRNDRRDLRDSLLQMVGLNVVITVVGYQYFSWQGHLGGLLAGAAATAVIVFAPRGPRRSTWQFLGLGALTALIVLGYLVRVLV